VRCACAAGSTQTDKRVACPGRVIGRDVEGGEVVVVASTSGPSATRNSQGRKRCSTISSDRGRSVEAVTSRHIPARCRDIKAFTLQASAHSTGPFQPTQPLCDSSSGVVPFSRLARLTHQGTFPRLKADPMAPSTAEKSAAFFFRAGPNPQGPSRSAALPAAWIAAPLLLPGCRVARLSWLEAESWRLTDRGQEWLTVRIEAATDRGRPMNRRPSNSFALLLLRAL